MTEEQELIDFINSAIIGFEARQIYAELSRVEEMQLESLRIALAALTAQPVKVDDSMALAFHKALNDGGVGHEDLEEIKVGLEAALCNIPRPAPAADLAELVPVVTRLKRRYVCNEGREFEFIACVTPDRSSIGTGQVWDDWRELSAILRKIKEAK